MTYSFNSPRLTFGVVLSGCGVQDGSEIHEATLLLLALDEAGIDAAIFAPDIPQSFTSDHITHQTSSDHPRSVLTESARIARGAIRPLDELDPDALDGLVFPGGFGAAVNLSDFATKGSAMKVIDGVERVIEAMHERHKPMGFICIAPILAACVLGKKGLTRPVLTIGNDMETERAIELLGANNVIARAEEVVVDHENRIVSTPAYMLAKRISQVRIGIQKLVEEMERLI